MTQRWGLRGVVSALIVGQAVSGCSLFNPISRRHLRDMAHGNGERREAPRPTASESTSQTESHPKPTDTPSDTNASQGFPPGMAAPMMRAYAMPLMMVYFWGAGAWLVHHPYQPGEWTRWKHEVSGDAGSTQQPLRVEKAFLHRTGNGSEWWRLKTDGEKPEQQMVFEVLFAPGHSKVIRMRARLGGGEVHELAFADGEMNIPTKTSLATMAKKHKAGRVKVPSGETTYKTDHIRFSNPGGEVNFYLSKKVPGGLVKYSFSNMQGAWYSVSLVAQGKNAITELGSY